MEHKIDGINEAFIDIEEQKEFIPKLEKEQKNGEVTDSDFLKIGELVAAQKKLMMIEKRIMMDKQMTMSTKKQIIMAKQRVMLEQKQNEMMMSRLTVKSMRTNLMQKK